MNRQFFFPKARLKKCTPSKSVIDENSIKKDRSELRSRPLIFARGKQINFRRDL